jgi:hypothetical protein
MPMSNNTEQRQLTSCTTARNAAVTERARNMGSEARLRINPTNPVFTDKVLSDVHRIRRTNAGRALFRRLRDAGRVITIERPEQPTDPPNAWTMLRDGLGIRGELVVVYDPSDWPNNGWSGCPPSDIVLFGRLLDAAVLASGASVSSQLEPAETMSVTSYLDERTTLSGTSRPEP